MSEIAPLFSDEVMLAGWKESHNSGATVTFWLADPTMLDSFRGLTIKKGNTAGQRLAMVLVEISDQETLVEQPAAPEAPKEPIGELCRLAVVWCKDEQFQQWSSLTAVDHGGKPHYHGFGEEAAKAFILDVCHVESRKDLDGSALAAARFHECVRLPYMDYLKGRE